MVSSHVPSSRRIGAARSATVTSNQRTTGGWRSSSSIPAAASTSATAAAGVPDLGEQHDVAAADRGARGVLDAEHDPDGALGERGLALEPSVPGRVVADELEERSREREGRGAAGSPRMPRRRSRGDVQQDELTVARGAQQFMSRRHGLLLIFAPGRASRAPGPAMNSCWPCALASARLTVSILRPSRRAARLRCLWHRRHEPAGPRGTLRPQVGQRAGRPYFSRQDLQATHIHPYRR